MKTNFSNDGMAYNLNVTITNDAIRLYLLFL